MMPGPMMHNAMSGPMMPGVPQGMAMPGRARRPIAVPRLGFELGHRAMGALVIAGVVIVLAIPVLFGLSRISALTSHGQSVQSAATRVPPAQAPAGFASFVGDAYSVAYPSGWSHSTKDLATSQGAIHADVFGDGKGAQATIAIGQPVPTNQLQMTVDDVAQRYFAPNLPQTVGQAGPRAYGEATWAAGDYTVATGSLGSQTVYELRVLAANFGVQTVVVVLQAKQQDFGAADSASFERLIQSFRFG